MMTIVDTLGAAVCPCEGDDVKNENDVNTVGITVSVLVGDIIVVDVIGDDVDVNILVTSTVPSPRIT